MPTSRTRWEQDERPALSTMGERVAMARQWKGLSQNKLAKLSKCTAGTIQQIENGSIKELKAALAFRISDVLEVSARWIIWGSGSIGKWIETTPEESELLRLYRQLPAPLQDHARGIVRDLRPPSPPSALDPFPTAPKPPKQ